MAKDIWINLPVKDLAKSKEFFTAIGFSLNPGPGNSEVSASFAIGDKEVILMLFSEAVFETFTGNRIPDANQGTEVLFSLGVGSRGEVDQLAKLVAEAGGTVFSGPQESQGWMYGCGFADLDGHRWNALYMDMSSVPAV